jgi:hypothetical protein
MAAFSDLCSAQSTSISPPEASIPIEATLCNLESMSRILCGLWVPPRSRKHGVGPGVHDRLAGLYFDT